MLKPGDLVRLVRQVGLKEAAKIVYYSRTAKMGDLKGVDRFGNKYFESGEEQVGRHRWVFYAKPNFDASQVPPEWHQWLHRMTDRVPDEVSFSCVSSSSCSNSLLDSPTSRNT